MSESLLHLRGVTKHFPVTKGLFGKHVGAVRAVDGVDLELAAGETVGLVGETGCGKSTLARLIMGLLPVTDGSITFEGKEITTLSRRGMRPLRRDMQMIFQDPYGSLNPRRRVGSIIGDPFDIHGIASGADARRRVQELMELVGLNPEHYNRFPVEFSGGQRQRIGIARALALKPKMIVCDEPVSALDVSIQAQVVNLLDDLQKELGLAYLFIAHDLSVVRHVSDRIAVMYLGRVVELADSAQLYATPRHPYTNALLSAVPVADPDEADRRQRIVLIGDIPSPLNPPSGCRFHPRCPKAKARCVTDDPVLTAGGGPDAEPGDEQASQRDLSACHYPVLAGEDLASSVSELTGVSAVSGIDNTDTHVPDPASEEAAP